MKPKNKDMKEKSKVTKRGRPETPVIKLPSSEYQPSKAEMEKEYYMPKVGKRALPQGVFPSFYIVEDGDS